MCARTHARTHTVRGSSSYATAIREFEAFFPAIKAAAALRFQRLGFVVHLLEEGRGGRVRLHTHGIRERVDERQIWEHNFHPNSSAAAVAAAAAAAAVAAVSAAAATGVSLFPPSFPTRVYPPPLLNESIPLSSKAPPAISQIPKKHTSVEAAAAAAKPCFSSLCQLLGPIEERGEAGETRAPQV